MEETSVILTFDNLRDAVDNDPDNNPTKELAELFLTAMYEWPSIKEDKIDEFVKQLKMFFGDPLTKDKITTKVIDLSIQYNAWRYEAGSSILELLQLSEKYVNQFDFDKIVNHLVNYYKDFAIRVVEINGKEFRTLDEFYSSLEKHLIKGNCPWGQNLDSLDEIVSNKFNYTGHKVNDVKKIIWYSFNKSQSELTELRGNKTVVEIIEEIFSSNLEIEFEKY